MLGETSSDASTVDGWDRPISFPDEEETELEGGLNDEECWKSGRPSALPDRAEHEIMRIRYESLRKRARRRDRRGAEVGPIIGLSGVSAHCGDGRRMGNGGARKIQRSNEDVWFTTLVEVELNDAKLQEQQKKSAVEKDVEPVWRDVEEIFFVDILREVDV